MGVIAFELVLIRALGSGPLSGEVNFNGSGRGRPLYTSAEADLCGWVLAGSAEGPSTAVGLCALREDQSSLRMTMLFYESWTTVEERRFSVAIGFALMRALAPVACARKATTGPEGPSNYPHGTRPWKGRSSTGRFENCGTGSICMVPAAEE